MEGVPGPSPELGAAAPPRPRSAPLGLALPGATAPRSTRPRSGRGPASRCPPGVALSAPPRALPLATGH